MLTSDDIIRLAREAGFTSLELDVDVCPECLARFAGLVASAEREACAQLCDGKAYDVARDCAEAIRARNNQPK